MSDDDVSTWAADLAIRCALVVLAILSFALVCVGWRIPEMIAIGVVLSLGAWIGAPAWRPRSHALSASFASQMSDPSDSVRMCSGPSVILSIQTLLRSTFWRTGGKVAAPFIMGHWSSGSFGGDRRRLQTPPGEFSSSVVLP